MFDWFTLALLFAVSNGFVISETIKAYAPTVVTPKGDITGFTDTVNVDAKLTKLRKFLGIPYAESPTGDGRFAKPVPKSKFLSPFNATQQGPACYQLTTNSPSPIGNYTYTEDCLVLNVISPEIADGDARKPVMIWIHGGGFTLGSSMDFSVDYFSAFGDVIVVTVNYRLAQLGFLSFGDSSAPGNFGLWDQHLAIKWVHDNIDAFGGDTSRVTIFGESAGSISVVFQSLYPGNKGLFQRVIAQSGTAIAAWSLQMPAMARQSAKEFAGLLACNQSSSSEMVRCLRSKSSDDINSTMNTPTRSYQSWGPVLDNDFVLDYPINIMNGSSKATTATQMFRDVDLIIGCNSRDGVVDIYTWMALLNETNIDTFKVSRDQFEKILIPHFLLFYFQRQIPTEVVDLGVFEYTDWSDPDDDNKRLNKLADVASDVLFYVPSIQTADNHVSSSTASTYMYKFSVKLLPHRFYLFPSALDAPDAANHQDDVGFLFRAQDADDVAKEAKELNITVSQLATKLRVSREMITMWTNFAKSGNPNKPVDITMYTNTAWNQYGQEENYLDILPQMAALEQGYAPEAVEFFLKIVPEILMKSNNSNLTA